MQKHTVIVTTKLANLRLDLAILQADIKLSRRKIRQIIDAGGVYLNQKRVKIASRIVQKDDKITVLYNLETLKKLKANNFEFKASDILYHNHGIIAINKPPLLMTQAAKDQDIQHVIPCLRRYFQDQGQNPPKMILVHRLDRETSGVLLVATTAHAAHWLGTGFKERLFTKIYHAICYNIPKQRHFSETCRLLPINRKGEVEVSDSPTRGKHSSTKFKLLESFSKGTISLIEAQPITGRSHQIRVHLAKNSLPIVGDKKYGDDLKGISRHPLPHLKLEHHFLHARSITFLPYENAKKVTITADYPPNWEGFLTNIRG